MVSLREFPLIACMVWVGNTMTPVKQKVGNMWIGRGDLLGKGSATKNQDFLLRWVVGVDH